VIAIGDSHDNRHYWITRYGPIINPRVGNGIFGGIYVSTRVGESKFQVV